MRRSADPLPSQELGPRRAKANADFAPTSERAGLAALSAPKKHVIERFAGALAASRNERFPALCLARIPQPLGRGVEVEVLVRYRHCRPSE